MNFATIIFCILLLRNSVLWSYGEILISFMVFIQSLVCWNVCSVIILRFLFGQNSCFDLSIILSLFPLLCFIWFWGCKKESTKRAFHFFFFFCKEVSSHFKSLNVMLLYSTRCTTRRNNFLLRQTTSMSVLWIAWCTVNVR